MDALIHDGRVYQVSSRYKITKGTKTRSAISLRPIRENWLVEALMPVFPDPQHREYFANATREWMNEDPESADGEVLAAYADVSYGGVMYPNQLVGVTGWFVGCDGLGYMRWHGVLEAHRNMGISGAILNQLCARVCGKVGKLIEVSYTFGAAAHFEKKGFVLTDDDALIETAKREAGGGNYVLTRRTDTLHQTVERGQLVGIPPCICAVSGVRAVAINAQHAILETSPHSLEARAHESWGVGATLCLDNGVLRKMRPHDDPMLRVYSMTAGSVSEGDSVRFAISVQKGDIEAQIEGEYKGEEMRLTFASESQLRSFINRNHDFVLDFVVSPTCGAYGLYRKLLGEDDGKGENGSTG